jgi:exo-1,4-beta-D-glucosaminidase
MSIRRGALAVLALVAGCHARQPPPLPVCERNIAPFRLELRDDWRLRSSADVGADAITVSTLGYDTSKWYATSVPSTVSGTLAEAGAAGGDPFFGMNLRNLPSMSYPIGAGFGDYDLAADSAFAVPWWYRTEFTLPAGFAGERVWLRLEGVSYRAQIWLNGRRIADDKSIVGTFRTFELDVTDQVTACQPNVLAIAVSAQRHDELGWNWVDWSPFPPDKDMGLWRPVVVETSGPVRLRHPYVHPRLPASDPPGHAELTVAVDATNATTVEQTAMLTGQIEDRTFTQSITLAPNETRTITFAPDQFAAALQIDQPRLWWPAQLGSPELYSLALHADVDGAVSDRAATTFGIREVTSELRADNTRLFRVNGKPLLVRGAGWAPDMFLRWPAERVDDELAYVADMHLNAIRLEGKLGIDRLYDDTDRAGILVIAGWCCCDHWEDWAHWSAEDYSVARASLTDQIEQLRAHPSVMVWLHGSDDAPFDDVEKMYVDVLTSLDWPNPQVNSANSAKTPILGVSGLKMPGPYMWVPPNYWYVDDTRGGAFGFDTETSAGAAIPPVESLKKFLPIEHLWPVDAFWLFHSGSATFVPLDVYQRALDARYGAAGSLDDFVDKSQLAAYEGVRAMFEAYGRNRYRSTGVIQWMLNNAWPGVIWHLYDYYLKPGGGYFGAKKANEPLHAQYSYDDASVVVTTLGPAVAGLAVTATVLALDGSEVTTRAATIDLDADATKVALSLADVTPPTTTYFVDLTLRDAGGAVVSRNLYWLSTRADVLDDANADWYHTPTLQDADLTGLEQMSMTALAASATRRQDGADSVVSVTLTNSSATLAFFARVEIAASADGDELVPVRWSDNYVSLRAGESRTLEAHVSRASGSFVVRWRGWNVAAASLALP